MAGYRFKSDPHRCLKDRDVVYQYVRRAPTIRISLKTNDLARAMTKRNEYESADQALWAMLKAGADGDKARAFYDAAIKRADAIGISYVSADLLLAMPEDALSACRRWRIGCCRNRRAPADPKFRPEGTLNYGVILPRKLVGLLPKGAVIRYSERRQRL
ncbi:hypothetical protein NQ774_04550 [Ochrobactrum sp. BD61]